MRYLIFDQDDTPQQFSLSLLFDRVNKVFPSESWLVVRAIGGYGKDIKSLEVALEGSDFLEVNSEKLIGLLKGEDQWFYSLEVVNLDQSIKFGLFDSTYMFFETRDLKASEICDAFSEVVEEA